ncbi:MAG: hypothetical protein AAGC55_04530 [Myxococcota bacterium]
MIRPLAGKSAGTGYRVHRRLVAMCATVVLILWASPSWADQRPPHAEDSGDVREQRASKAAERYLQRGLRHYDQARYERAIAAFWADYRTQPRPEFLFALAQAERRSGDCPSALVYYQRFLDTEPPARQVRAAHLHMQRCRTALESQPKGHVSDHRAQQSPAAAAPAPQPTSAPGTSAAPALQLDKRPGPSRSPWYRDPAGNVLLGTAAAGVALGVGLLSVSYSSQERARLAETYTEYDMYLARTRRFRTWGVVAVASGTILLAASLHRFAIRPRIRSPRHDLAVIPLRDGVSVSYGGSF